MPDSHVVIRPCTVAEIEQSETLPELLAAYGRESSIHELGQSAPCMQTYRQMAAAGVFHAIGAFSPELVGVATLIVYGLPHYAGRRIASMESIFVAPDARRFGTGLKLLRAAEQCAHELGAMALIVSAPVGGRLAELLPRTSGYRETNRVFTKGLT